MFLVKAFVKEHKLDFLILAAILGTWGFIAYWQWVTPPSVLSTVLYGAVCAFLAYVATSRWILFAWLGLMLTMGATNAAVITRLDELKQAQENLSIVCAKAKQVGAKIYGFTESKPDAKIDVCVEGAQ